MLARFQAQRQQVSASLAAVVSPTSDLAPASPSSVLTRMLAAASKSESGPGSPAGDLAAMRHERDRIAHETTMLKAELCGLCDDSGSAAQWSDGLGSRSAAASTSSSVAPVPARRVSPEPAKRFPASGQRLFPAHASIDGQAGPPDAARAPEAGRARAGTAAERSPTEGTHGAPADHAPLPYRGPHLHGASGDEAPDSVLSDERGQGAGTAGIGEKPTREAPDSVFSQYLTSRAPPRDGPHTPPQEEGGERLRRAEALEQRAEERMREASARLEAVAARMQAALAKEEEVRGLEEAARARTARAEEEVAAAERACAARVGRAEEEARAERVRVEGEVRTLAVIKEDLTHKAGKLEELLAATSASQAALVSERDKLRPDYTCTHTCI